jgi:hypothetical protein
LLPNETDSSCRSYHKDFLSIQGGSSGNPGVGCDPGSGQ